MNWKQLIEQITLAYLFTPSVKARIELLEDALSYPLEVRQRLAFSIQALLGSYGLLDKLSPFEQGLLESLNQKREVGSISEFFSSGAKAATDIISAVNKFRDSDSMRAIMEKCASGKANAEFCRMFLKFRQGKSLSNEEKDYLKKYLDSLRNRSQPQPQLSPVTYQSSRSDSSTNLLFLGAIFLILMMNMQGRRSQ